MNQRVLRLGTRGSALARWQADWVTAQLQQAGVEVQQVLITTQGDVRTGPLGVVGGQGLFTKEIQRALLDDRVDLAVHSLKDLPTDAIDGLVLAAVPRRESCGDVLVSDQARDVETLAQGSRVGTGSMRRRAQLLHQRPDLSVLDIRGNVDTRLRQLDEGNYDAIVLAEAGLKRLGLADRITHVLAKSWMLPAIGQGALGLETRAHDDWTRQRVSLLDDADTHRSVLAERRLLSVLHGGCLAPVGAWGRVEEGRLYLDAAVLDPQGTRRLLVHVEGAPDEALSLGEQAACELLAQGANELINAARREQA